MANKWTVLTESETSVTIASGTLTSDLPVFGAGGATVKAGTKTGNTDEVVTATGAATANRPLLFDANGNAVARQPRGNTTVVQLADSITNPTNGNVAGFDANGNVRDSGLAAASLLVNPLTTKGDLIGYGTGVSRLGAGTNGQVLTANSGAANGVDWEALPTATSSALGLVKPDNSSITISGGVISAAGGGTGGVNSKTASYTAVSGDAGKLISFNSSSAVTLTLPTTPPSSTWAVFTENVRSGILNLSAGSVYPSGWSSRQAGKASGGATDALITFDSTAAAATSCSVTITATSACNIFSVLTALKPSGSSAPGYVQGAMNSRTTGTFGSLAQAFASANTAGGCLVLDVYMTSASPLTGTVSVSDSAGNTWTFVAGGAGTTASIGGVTPYFATFVAPNCAAGSNTVTLSTSINAGDMILAIHEYSGVAASSPVDTSSALKSSSASSLTPSVTTTGTNRTLHLFGATFNNFLISTVLDGGSIGLALAQNQGVYITTDGTNYFTQRGMGGSSGSVSAPTATSSTLGIVKPDNSTITISGGVISASAGAVTSLTTTGSSGASTLSSGVLNIPVYAGGSGAVTTIYLASLIVYAAESTNSTSYVDLTTADTIAFTLSATTTVLIEYSADVANNGSGFTQWDAIYIDASKDTPSERNFYYANSGNAPTTVRLIKSISLASGSHTITVKHRTDGGSGYTWYNRLLTAVASTSSGLATTSAPGIVQPDGTSITIAGGIISAVSSGGGGGALSRISQQVLASTSGSVTFSAIPQTYTNLILTVTGRVTGSGSPDCYMQANGDTGTNYDAEVLWESGGGATTYATSQAWVMSLANSGAPANQAGSARITIQDYTNTTFFKNSVSSVQRKDGATTGYTLAYGWTWRNTAAITSLVLTPLSGSFAAGSIFTLYGEGSGAAGTVGASLGARASLPSSIPAAGNSYLCTDSPYSFVSTGSAWQAFFQGVPVSEPVNSTFTWQNQSTATVSATYGGCNLLSAVGANASNVNGRYISYPSAPFTITAAMRLKMLPTSSGSPTNAQAGLYLSDGTKVITFSIYGYSQTVAIQYGPSLTNITTNVITGRNASHADLIWLRFSDNGTTRIYSISFDGITFVQVYSEGNTTNLTATQIGFQASAYDTGTYSQNWFVHWLKT